MTAKSCLVRRMDAQPQNTGAGDPMHPRGLLKCCISQLLGAVCAEQLRRGVKMEGWSGGELHSPPPQIQEEVHTARGTDVQPRPGTHSKEGHRHGHPGQTQRHAPTHTCTADAHAGPWTLALRASDTLSLAEAPILPAWTSRASSKAQRRWGTRSWREGVLATGSAERSAALWRHPVAT